jgi:hypothetical protein
MLALPKLLGAVIVAMVACAALSSAHAQSQLTAGSSWINERGSVLTITNIGSNGLLSGTYVTAVGCSAGQPRPMTGWFYGAENGGAITFSVIWQGCNTVTSWSGQFNNQTGGFQTLWLLTAASAPVWNGIHTGTDTFMPLSTLPK